MSVSILVIDDSPDFLQLAERLLGRHVDGAAVTLLDPNTIGLSDTGFGLGEHDLVLLDYDLGDAGDGIEWLRKVTALGPFPPTVVITSSADPYVAAQAIKSGAADYLAKPDVNGERLAAVVGRVLESARSAQIADRRASSTVAASSLIGAARAGTHLPATERTTVLHQGDTGAPGTQGSGAVRVRGYTVDSKLGEGATAQVYLARRNRDGQVVVLKIVTPELLQSDEFLERFLQEAELVIDIDSHNVVKIYEQAFTDDGGFIAMELLPGGDLRAAMADGVDAVRAVDYFRQIARGLSSIHAVGIVHRDLKPANVMLREDGTLALVDFGISKRSGTSELTQVGSILGTPFYMSPEQARGQEVDARSDLYAAGVMLYEMLTGEKPFTGSGPAEVLYKHAYGDRPRLPPEFSRYQEFLDLLLAVDRESRPADAARMLEAFDRI